MESNDDFRFYMIDNMKYWSDKLRKCNEEHDKNFGYVASNVLEELISVFVSYEKINVGEDVVVDFSDLDLIIDLGSKVV